MFRYQRLHHVLYVIVGVSIPTLRPVFKKSVVNTMFAWCCLKLWSTFILRGRSFFQRFIHPSSTIVAPIVVVDTLLYDMASVHRRLRYRRRYHCHLSTGIGCYFFLSSSSSFFIMKEEAQNEILSIKGRKMHLNFWHVIASHTIISRNIFWEKNNNKI